MLRLYFFKYDAYDCIQIVLLLQHYKNAILYMYNIIMSIHDNIMNNTSFQFPYNNNSIIFIQIFFCIFGISYLYEQFIDIDNFT
jgi:hypothetical protein